MKRRLLWSLGVMFAFLLLSTKEVDWVYGSWQQKLPPLVLGAAVGAAVGFLFSLITSPARSKSERIQKPLLWIFTAFMFGVWLGHGNVPYTVTLKIAVYASIVGIVIGAVHYLSLEMRARRKR